MAINWIKFNTETKELITNACYPSRGMVPLSPSEEAISFDSEKISIELCHSSLQPEEINDQPVYEGAIIDLPPEFDIEYNGTLFQLYHTNKKGVREISQEQPNMIVHLHCKDEPFAVKVSHKDSSEYTIACKCIVQGGVVKLQKLSGFTKKTIFVIKEDKAKKKDIEDKKKDKDLKDALVKAKKQDILAQFDTLPAASKWKIVKKILAATIKDIDVEDL